jgi:type IV pilus assembly protein PilV
MLICHSKIFRRQHGLTLIEVLVTIVILAFGLLGLAGLQSKLHIGMIESYQRAQAVILLQDMVDRMKADLHVPCRNLKSSNCDPSGTTINANYTAALNKAAAYIAANPVGTGDSQPSDCSSTTTTVARNLCEWSNQLKGAAEIKGSANAGAMESARGCIIQLQAIDGTPGVCQPGIYQLTVVWQGIHPTTPPAVTCGQGLYGTDTYRRAISTEIAVPLPQC